MEVFPSNFKTLCATWNRDTPPILEINLFAQKTLKTKAQSKSLNIVEVKEVDRNISNHICG